MTGEINDRGDVRLPTAGAVGLKPYGVDEFLSSNQADCHSYNRTSGYDSRTDLTLVSPLLVRLLLQTQAQYCT